MAKENGSKEVIPFCPKPHNRSVAKQGRKCRSLASQDVAFSIGLCCCLASRVDAIRIKEQNGLIFYLSRQDDKWVFQGFLFLTWNKIWWYFIITLQHRQKEQCVLLCLNLTVSKEAENSWILGKWVYFTILKRLETALIPWKSIWKALLAVAELMKVKLPSERWKGRIQKKKC